MFLKNPTLLFLVPRKIVCDFLTCKVGFVGKACGDQTGEDPGPSKALNKHTFNDGVL